MFMYANEMGFALEAKQVQGGLEITVLELQNSPNDGREIAKVTIANYRVRNDLLPVAQAVVSELNAMEAKSKGQPQ